MQINLPSIEINTLLSNPKFKEELEESIAYCIETLISESESCWDIAREMLKDERVAAIVKTEIENEMKTNISKYVKEAVDKHVSNVVKKITVNTLDDKVTDAINKEITYFLNKEIPDNLANIKLEVSKLIRNYRVF